MSSSIVSPNVGEELRIYAKEQEDLMRQRVADYHQQQDAEYRRVESETQNKMQLIEYLARAEKNEVLKTLQSLDELIEIFSQPQEVGSCVNNQFVDQMKSIEDARRQNAEFVRKELTGTITRFLDIKKVEIQNKFHRLKILVDFIRETNVDWIDDVCDRKRLDSVFSEIDAANSNLSAAATLARKSKFEFESSTIATARVMTQNACQTLGAELESELTRLINDLDCDIRFRVSHSRSVYRRTLIAVAKRIHDIQQCVVERKQQAVGEAVSEYRRELLKLFSRYISVVGERGEPLGDRMTVDFESIWSRRTPVSQLYRIKFIQQFFDRFGVDPNLARTLHDVLTQH